MLGRKQRGVVHFIETAVGTVFHILATLVLHRVALHFEFFLGHCIQQEPHAITFEPQHAFEQVARHGFEIVGAVFVGSTVHVATGFGYGADVLFIGYVLRSLEHHVLEEVGEARALWLFPRRAHMVGDIHMHQRIAVVFVHDYGEAVVELEFAVGNDQVAVAGRHGFQQGVADWRGCFRGRGWFTAGSESERYDKGEQGPGKTWVRVGKGQWQLHAGILNWVGRGRRIKAQGIGACHGTGRGQPAGFAATKAAGAGLTSGQEVTLCSRHSTSPH